MTVIPGVILGVVLGVGLVYLARRFPPNVERRIYAIGLVFAAVVYVVFGLIGGASSRWLTVESIGVLVYGIVSWAGLRGRPWLLAFGWIAHVAWDLSLHVSGAGAEYTPSWYPWLCVGTDLVIGGAILFANRDR